MALRLPLLLLLLLVLTARAAQDPPASAPPLAFPGAAPAGAGLGPGQLPPMRFPDGPSREQLIGREAPDHQPPVARPRLAIKSSAVDSSAGTASANVTATTTASAERQPFVEPTKSAGILIGVFVGLALLGYAGLLVWRRVLERRYGNREILVNEEQFEQERDLSNFQL